MIFDHEDVDIVLMPTENKIISFAKDMFSDKVYEAQDRLFKYLKNKGVIAFESIQGGNVYGSMEAAILTSINEDVDPMQATLYSVSKFIDEEKPYFRAREDHEEDEMEYLLEPGKENSTEL